VDAQASGGWIAAVILMAGGVIAELLRRRTARLADKERGPIEGFTALTAAQTGWAQQLLAELGAYRDEIEALRAELVEARREIAALRKQIRESG